MRFVTIGPLPATWFLGKQRPDRAKAELIFFESKGNFKFKDEMKVFFGW